MDGEAYADRSPLVVLCASGRARILSVLVDERSRDLSKSELARQAGIARTTLDEHLPVLEDLGVVLHSPTSGASKRYRLNPDSEIATLAWQLDGAILRTLLELPEPDRHRLQGTTPT